MNLDGTTRADRVAIAQRLLAEVAEEGVPRRERKTEVARRMGVARSLLYEWLADPDRSRAKARRATYAGTCVDCGAKTDGSRGPGHAPARCGTCQNRDNRPRLYRPSRFCGVPGCNEPKKRDRHVCAGHAPEYDRLRLIVQASEPTVPWGDPDPYPADGHRAAA